MMRRPRRLPPSRPRRTVKSIFLARRYLEANRLDLSFVPEFSDSDQGLTVMNFYVLAHAPRAEAAGEGSAAPGTAAAPSAPAAAASSEPAAAAEASATPTAPEAATAESQ